MFYHRAREEIIYAYVGCTVSSIISIVIDVASFGSVRDLWYINDDDFHFSVTVNSVPMRGPLCVSWLLSFVTILVTTGMTWTEFHKFVYNHPAIFIESIDGDEEVKYIYKDIKTLLTCFTKVDEGTTLMVQEFTVDGSSCDYENNPFGFVDTLFEALIVITLIHILYSIWKLVIFFKIRNY